MQTIQTQDILVDGIHLAESRIGAGKSIIAKARPFNRVYVLAEGSVTAGDTGYTAPAYIQISADQECPISTLSDVVIYGIETTPAETVEQITHKDVEIGHYFAGGVYAKQMTIAKDCKIPTHKHVYDHLSILAKGRVQVTVSRETVEYVAPAAIEIKRDLVHTLTAIEDSVWYCIHATEETDPESANKTIIVGRT
jgi:quercetin dioxygenase-like cupin family protein